MLQIVKYSLALILTLAIGLPASAQDSPLKHFSQDADVVIRLKEPDRTYEKLVELIDKIQPAVATQIRSQQNEVLGGLISNPTLTGVDISRDWYIAVYAQGEDAPPVVVFAIPAVNAEDLVGALGPDMTSKVHGKWVLYTENESVPEATEAASVVTRLQQSGGSNSLFDSSDLSIYVNLEHLSTVYERQIELAQDQVLDGLNQLRFLPQEGGMNLEPFIDLYGRMAEAAFQGVEDGRATIISISLNGEDIAVRTQVAFKKESASSQFLAKNPNSAMPQLTKLPSGASMYYGISGNIKEFMKMGLTMSSTMIAGAASPEELKTQLADLEEIQFGDMVSSINIVDSDKGVLRAASVVDSQPIDKVRKFARESAQAFGNMDTALLKQSTTIQPDAETYGDYKADVVVVKQEFSEDTDPSGIQKKMNLAMFGEGGVQTRNLYMKDSYASTIGGGEAAMKSLIKSLNSEKANNLVPYREKLIKQANSYVFLDLSGILANAARAATRFEGVPLQLNAQMIDALNLKPSYISAALGSEPDTLVSEIRVPVEQIIGVTKLGIMVGASFQQGF